jgi:hypothetical protein
MSLKGFHLVFVTLSTLMCMFLAVWSYMLAPEPSTMATILGVVGLVGTILMPIYGVCFYRKISRIHI